MDGVVIAVALVLLFLSVLGLVALYKTDFCGLTAPLTPKEETKHTPEEETKDMTMNQAYAGPVTTDSADPLPMQAQADADADAHAQAPIAANTVKQANVKRVEPIVTTALVGPSPPSSRASFQAPLIIMPCFVSGPVQNCGVFNSL